MGNITAYEQLKNELNPHKEPDKEWFLDLLDDGKQKLYEDRHMEAVMRMLRFSHIREHRLKIAEAKAEIARIEAEEEHNAENYCKVTELLKECAEHQKKIDACRCFFDEPYFARMDLTDPAEGYNSYYIGKKGDVKLEIVDWRAPLARKYYQKSRISFSINQYDYKTILRRALRTKEGRVLDFKNEFLSVRDYLTSEEIGGRDEEILFDPYLREIIRNRKEEPSVRDIIETIQEKQYEIITCPERKNFVLQGCAGSGKTMVMLHRLSYLMYNNEEIRPRDVLVLTPSDTFNDFIDELSAVLELERVKTVTLSEYFLQVLKNEKIDLTGRISRDLKETEEYLAYVYSPRFVSDLKKKLDKVYDSLYGLFTGEECREFVGRILSACKNQLSAYEAVKNSSLRIRRAVLGEIKEKKEGGLYYTKPFREFMNCILDIEDFFAGTLKSEQAKNQSYFYRQLMSFYRSAAFVSRHGEQIVGDALGTLDGLKTSLEKEIIDLKRYRQKLGQTEVYIYADRIERREQLIAEIVKISEKVRSIGEEGIAFAEFYGYFRGEKNFSALGGGEDFVDVVRFFYRETVRKQKLRYGLKKGAMYPSDAYALCTICALLGRELTPRYSFVFVDEAQDISPGEYDLLRKINVNASFDVFGDLEQNITPWRGVGDWHAVFPDFEIFTLNQNYRNTNQIVGFVSSTLEVDMQPIGFDGPEVGTVPVRGIGGFFQDKKGLKAVICSEQDKEKYVRKAYSVLSDKGKVSRTKVNFMTVYESKGLEFTSVAVIPDHMSVNEKYIACTRALKELAIVADKAERTDKTEKTEKVRSAAAGAGKR